jgi:hypothetical protein
MNTWAPGLLPSRDNSCQAALLSPELDSRLFCVFSDGNVVGVLRSALPLLTNAYGRPRHGLGKMSCQEELLDPEAYISLPRSANQCAYNHSTFSKLDKLLAFGGQARFSHSLWSGS